MVNLQRKLEMGAAAITLGGAIVAGGFGVASATTVSHPHVPTLSGTVSEVTDSGFTVTSRSGTATPVVTTAATVYRETGSPVVPGGVTDGEFVVVKLAGGPTSRSDLTTSTTATGSTPYAAVVQIILPSEFGVVKSVDDGTFTLSQWGGRTATVDTNSSTAFYSASFGRPAGGATATTTAATKVTSVTTGEFVAAYGNYTSSTDTLDASIVDVYGPPAAKSSGPWVSSASSPRPGPGTSPAWHQPSAAPTGFGLDPRTRSTTAASTTSASASSETSVTGTVTSVSGDVIILIEAGQGTTWTVTTSSSTTYNDPCGPSITPGVSAGETIKAVGTSTGTDALTAVQIAVLSRSGDPGTGWGHERSGGSDPGHPSGWAPAAGQPPSRTHSDPGSGARDGYPGAGQDGHDGGGVGGHR